MIFEGEKLEALEDKVDGVFLGMEAGFRDIRKDVKYLGQAYLPLIAMTIIALVLAICSLVIALENRALILHFEVQSRAEQLAPNTSAKR